MMMALPFISFRPLIAALLHSVAWQPQTFYDPSQKRGEVPLAREQRKLAAILAADDVVYSRLMGRDESGTLARLAAISTRIVAARPWGAAAAASPGSPRCPRAPS